MKNNIIGIGIILILFGILSVGCFNDEPEDIVLHISVYNETTEEITYELFFDNELCQRETIVPTENEGTYLRPFFPVVKSGETHTIRVFVDYYRDETVTRKFMKDNNAVVFVIYDTYIYVHPEGEPLPENWGNP